MSTAFPGGLDSFVDPTPSDDLSTPSHSGQHADANHALLAIETKVGITGSADTTSLDYKTAGVYTAAGDILVGSGAGTATKVAAGATDRVLRSNGTGTQPSWQTDVKSFGPSGSPRTGVVNPAVGDYLAVPTGGLTGATQACRFVGATTAGAPASGTFGVGDVVVDQSGTLWVCTTAGTPGTWAQLAVDSLVLHKISSETVRPTTASLPALHFIALSSQSAPLVTLAQIATIGTGDMLSVFDPLGNVLMRIDVHGGLCLREATNSRSGVATLASGHVTVANTTVTSSTRVKVYLQTASPNAGFLSVSVSAGTSFSIVSANTLDTSTVYWELSEPA